jgi:HSP20 family protein
MAEPQANTEQQKTGRDETTKGTTTQSGATQQEARSFREPGGGGEAPGQGVAQSSRQLAETGRRAGRQVADAWGRSLDPFFAFQHEVDRWFDDMWRQFTGAGMPSPLRTARPLSTMSSPAPLFGIPPADLKETEQAYQLAVELPGLSREDIDLQLRDDLLIIRGHKAEESEDAKANYRFAERRFGRFERAFPIPDDVDPSGVDANFRDGVLRISLPKRPEAAQRTSKIEIKG